MPQKNKLPIGIGLIIGAGLAIGIGGFIFAASKAKPVPPAEVLIFNDIDILRIGGRDIVNVIGNTGELAEPIVVNSLKGITVNWLDKTLLYGPTETWLAGDTGVIFHLWYEPAWDAVFPCNSPPAYRGSVSLPPRGTPLPKEMSTRVNSLFGGGYWCPGIYNGYFTWHKIEFSGAQYDGGTFRIKNMVECIGEGQT